MEIPDKKKRILQAALHLFSTYGIKNTTVEQIAKQSKVGKGTLYLYFKDKEALFVAVMEQEWSRFSDNCMSEMDPSLPFLSKVNSWLTRITQHRAHDAFFQKIYAEYLDFQTAEIGLGLKNAQLSAIHIIENIVKEGISSKQVPASLSPQMLAFLLVKGYAAFTYEWPKEYAPINETDVKNLLESLLGHYSEKSEVDIR